MEPAADLLTKTFVQNELFVARFDLVIGSDERRGKVHIAVPYEVLDTLVLGNGQERALETADHSDWEHQLKAVASFAEVTVRGVIHREQIAREDLAALAVGQFIRLPRARMSAVDIMVVASDGDKKIATGHLGAYRERKVLKVLDGPSAESPEMPLQCHSHRIGRTTRTSQAKDTPGRLALRTAIYPSLTALRDPAVRSWPLFFPFVLNFEDFNST